MRRRFLGRFGWGSFGQHTQTMIDIYRSMSKVEIPVSIWIQVGAAGDPCADLDGDPESEDDSPGGRDNYCANRQFADELAAAGVRVGPRRPLALVRARRAARRVGVVRTGLAASRSLRRHYALESSIRSFLLNDFALEKAFGVLPDARKVVIPLAILFRGTIESSLPRGVNFSWRRLKL